MRIAFGTDEETALTRSVRGHLEGLGHVVISLAGGEAWPEVGRAVGESGRRRCGRDFGVACCYTGTGVSIAANKVGGVRAALCTDAATAAGARRWNDANVLVHRASPRLGGCRRRDARCAFSTEADDPEELRDDLAGRREPEVASPEWRRS